MPRHNPLQHKLGMRLRHAQKAVLGELAARFQDYGVTPRLFAILVLIEAHPRCRQWELACLLDAKAPNLVKALNLLIQRGLVLRAEDPDNRRMKVLTLAPAGRDLLAELRRVDEEVEASFKARLGDDGYRRLIELLGAVL